MICNVNGKIGHNDYATVGSIFSEFPLDSMQFDIATFKFNDDYKGVVIDSTKQASVFTYVKSVCGTDRDIACPICLVSSPYDSDVNVLASGWVSTIKPSDKNRLIHCHPAGSFVIMFVVPGKTKDSVIEYTIMLPSSIAISRKVIYIKDFDVYISGCDRDILYDIIHRKNAALKLSRGREPIVDIHIKANIPHRKRVTFCFNGIIGETIIDKTEDAVGTVTVTIGSTTLIKNVVNKQFLSFENQIVCSWEDFGGINLIIDDNYDRLVHAWNRIRDISGCVDQDSFDRIKQLIAENRELKQTIDDINLKLKQEEHKTFREEIKTQSVIQDQRHAGLMEAIKLTGSVLGAISLVITVVSKMSTPPADKKKLIEWAIPIGKKSLVKVSENKEIMIGAVASVIVAGSFVLLYRKMSAL